MSTSTKICLRCHQELPLTEFYRNRARNDGRQAYCKACSLAAVKAYQQSGKGQKTIHQRRLDTYADLGKTADLLKHSHERQAWWEGTPHVCHYCGTSLEAYLDLREAVLNYSAKGGTNPNILKFCRLFKSAKHTSSLHLTIVQRDNEQGYELDNIVKACWICAGLKEDFLTESQTQQLMHSVIQDLQEELHNT